MMLRQFPSILGRRCQKSCASSSSSSSALLAEAAPRSSSYRCYTKNVQTSSFHSSCNNYLPTIPKCCPSNSAISITSFKSSHHVNNSISKRLLSSSIKPSASTSSNITNATKFKGGTTNNKSNAPTKYFTTKTTNQDPIINCTTETELAQLRSEIATLSYLIKQTSSQQMETQILSRRAEARAYIIENKLMDIQRHVVKIPALEDLSHNLRQYLKDYSPTYVSDAFRRVNESSASFLTSKYTAWLLFGGMVVFWQYRLTMYESTAEEVANVAAMTLQQDSLRKTIQETLTTVANSPETLASLSILFQKLISEERTEQHLINLIVRALNSEGVRDAAIYLLDVCFQNPELQVRAGEFLKVAANATVLDEGVQKSAGVGIQQALKSAVLPWWAKSYIAGTGSNVSSSSASGASASASGGSSSTTGNQHVSGGAGDGQSALETPTNDANGREKDDGVNDNNSESNNSRGTANANVTLAKTNIAKDS